MKNNLTVKRIRPVVLIHGLWNDSEIFKQVLIKLDEYKAEYFAPTLKHNFGMISIVDLAESLDKEIINHYGPQKEIDIVLELKSIKQFFKEVKGDSIYKSNTLKNLLAQIGNKGKCVFIGDSEGDYIAAKECNVDFILKTSSLNKNLQNIPKMKVI